jgi:hypothetical protein
LLDVQGNISGGPVAGSLAEYLIRNPSHFEPLREAIPPFGEKNLQIVNLANGGYKQAQQFFVAVFHALVSHPISTILWRAQTRGILSRNRAFSEVDLQEYEQRSIVLEISRLVF